MKTKQKRKYNLFWLIFWIIICFPIAYYYYFKKQYPDKKILKEKPQMYIFLICWIVFFIFMVIVDSIEDQQTTPEQEISSNKGDELTESKRQIGIVGDRYDSGSISYNIVMSDETGYECDWIGGTLKLYIKDDSGNLINTHTQKISEAHTEFCTQIKPYLDIYVGSIINDVKSMDGEFQSSEGLVYTIKNVDLSRMLKS